MTRWRREVRRHHAPFCPASRDHPRMIRDAHQGQSVFRCVRCGRRYVWDDCQLVALAAPPATPPPRLDRWLRIYSLRRGTGRVHITPGGVAAVERMWQAASQGAPLDWTVRDVTLTPWGPHDASGGGLALKWTTASAGFGEIRLWLDKDGGLFLSTEATGRAHALAVLGRLLDQATLVD